MEIRCTKPRSCVKLSKEYVTQNEASRANLNVDKRIFELPPLMHRVYSNTNRMFLDIICNFNRNRCKTLFISSRDIANKEPWKLQ